MKKFLVRTSTNYLLGWASALENLKQKVYRWDKSKPTFDVFNEFSPDYVLCNSSDLTRSLFKCLIHNQDKCKLLVWLNYPEEAAQHEKEGLTHLRQNTKLFITYLVPTTRNFISNYREFWGEEFDICASPPACRLPVGRFDERLVCDVGYYGIKTSNAVEKLALNNINVKIFSVMGDNPDWPFVNWLGWLTEQEAANLYTTANISLSVPEKNYPHYIDESLLNIIGAGGLGFSQTTLATGDMLECCYINYENNTSIYTALDFYKNNSNYRNEILQGNIHYIYNVGNTYEHRIKEILGALV